MEQFDRICTKINYDFSIQSITTFILALNNIKSDEELNDS